MEMPTSSVSVSLSEISAQRTQLLVELSALTEGDGLGDLLCGKKTRFSPTKLANLMELVNRYRLHQEVLSAEIL